MPSGLRFANDESVSLGIVSDLYQLLRAIDETMPKDAVLYIEGTSVAPSIKEFLSSRPAPATRDVARSTISPVPDTFHLQLAGTNLTDLRSLAEGRAEPEIGDHIAVYRDDELLLFAPDAGGGEVLLAGSLPEETIESFRESLGMG
jgi:hypothetical protein